MLSPEPPHDESCRCDECEHAYQAELDAHYAWLQAIEAPQLFDTREAH